MVTLGVIVGNRGFFPDHLCESGRKTILNVLKEEGIKTVVLPLKETKYGAVESLSDAKACAELFKKNRDKIDGILVTLPNFGDERGVANAIRLSELDVPVLVHAFSDDSAHMTIENRRDSFCGKMSVCNNLRQYGIEYSLTQRHTVDPESEEFRSDLQHFAAICRIVQGLKHVRFGMLGARPAAFNTVRFSEKLLEAYGISIETLDLSEVLGQANRMKDNERGVKKKLNDIQAYTKTKGVPDESLRRMAKLGVVIDRWMKENELAATAIQCWTSMEEFYGVVPCTLMSIMSNALLPSACETDIAGLIGMYILQCASGSPSALLDWNNNYGDDPDKAMVFHCSNLPKHFFSDQKMEYQAIVAGAVGKENTFGTITGRIKPGPFTYCRISTDDSDGEVLAYCGQGAFTKDKVETFGGFGVVEIPHLQELLHYICEYGFEHHVAVNLSQVSDAVYEALAKYLDWDVYYHHD
jgi:L-fucose isomerase-like protein